VTATNNSPEIPGWGRPPSIADGGAERFAWNATMRAEAPVVADETGVWHIFRYADAYRALSDHAVFSSNPGRILPEFGEAQRGNMGVVDPPEHHTLRRLVSRAFTPKRVAELEPRIVTALDALLTNLAGIDEPDLIRDLTYPLPVIVIGDLLGVPESDRGLYRDWVDHILSEPGSPNTGMRDYLGGLLAQRRRNPTDDLLSGLAGAEVDGVRLSDEEVVVFAQLLLMAGHITTTMMLGNAMLCFHEHPDALAEVRADRSLLPAALEEVLRFRSPLIRLFRIPTEDVELSGTTIPANSMVSVNLLSANHDERQFTGGDTFDIHRVGNNHLAFAMGVHYCLGAPLAKLEGRLALGMLFDRFSDIEVGDGLDLGYQPAMMFGVRSMPVRLKPA
jgi:cytochrome P450